MKAALLNLIFDIASLLNTHITKHFRKNPFEGIVSYLPARWSIRILNSLISIVTDIKGCTIKMARVLCCILITTTQFLYIFL